MTKEEAIKLIHTELDKISCYQVSPEELIEIVEKAGATFLFNRGKVFLELKELSEKASKDLKESLERLEEHNKKLGLK